MLLDDSGMDIRDQHMVFRIGGMIQRDHSSESSALPMLGGWPAEVLVKALYTDTFEVTSINNILVYSR